MRIEGLTDSNGNAALAGLPDGTDTVSAYKSGYRPADGPVAVEAGAGEATITLATGEVAASTLKSQEMTLSEIEAAGIDTSDPSNEKVFEFEVRLAFTESTEASDQFHCYINGNGEFVGDCTGSGGVMCTPTECEGGGGGGGFVIVPGIVEGHPLIQWLILRGKAAVLKQFFTVSMVVQNLSPEPFKITGGSAALNLPAGMSLAPTPNPQTATQSVADIAGMGSSAATWIVRGDAPGEYYLSADYHGDLQPFQAPIALQAELSQPLRVWGANALALNVRADSGHLAEGVPYHVSVGITNTANVPLYNVGVSIDATTHERFIFQPDQDFTNTISELAPGQTIYAKPIILVPNAVSEAAFDPALSSAQFAGEEIKPGAGIEAVPPPTLYAISAPRDTPNMVHLHWEQVPGAEGYEVFPTTDLNTPFAEGAETVLSSPSSEAGVTELSATATNAYILGSGTEKPKYYAVSSVINGVPTLEFPVITASAGAQPPPSGGEPPPSGGEPPPSSGSGPGLGVSWALPSFSQRLYTLEGSGDVPFDVALDGKVSGHGTLAVGTEASAGSTPSNVYQLTDPHEGTVKFSLLEPLWQPAYGVTGPTAALELTLAWPTVSKLELELPLFAITGSVGLNRPFAQVALEIGLSAVLSTSIKEVAEWVVTKLDLGPEGAAEGVAQWLIQNAATITRAYGTILVAAELRGRFEKFLEESIPFAHALGIAVKDLEKAVQFSKEVLGAAYEKLSSLGEGFVEVAEEVGGIVGLGLREPMARAAVAQSVIPPLGTRAKLRLRPLRMADIRRGAWRSIKRSDARRVAHTLIFPQQPLKLGHLLTTATTVRSGGRIGVMAARLLSTSQVVLTVVGPHFSGEYPLGVNHGFAGAEILLPRHLTAGTYYVGVGDLSHLRRGHGSALLAAATFKVSSPGPHRR